MDMSWQALLQEAAATSFEKTADTLVAAENGSCACVDLHQQQIHELSKKILLLPYQGIVLLLSRYCFRLSPEETEMFFHLENAKGCFRFYKELLSSSMGVEAGHMISDDTFGKACHIALKDYLHNELEATPVNESELPGEESTSQNDILQIGIRKATAGVYDEEGLKFTWSVENIGDYSVSFDKNMIAQIVLNGEDYAFETEAVTLEPGEAYSVDISIPYPVARQNGTNNVKITATTGDTTATYKESFTH